MTDESEGYDVAHSEALGHWYVIHRQRKGSVLHRTILADQYDTQADAEQAAEAMQQTGV